MSTLRMQILPSGVYLTQVFTWPTAPAQGRHLTVTAGYTPSPPRAWAPLSGYLALGQTAKCG
jgi:hypothetical protein